MLKGGLTSKAHVEAGFFNLGEKIWYWILIFGGLIVSVSGLILVLQNFGQGRIVMELSHVVHVVTAVLLMAMSLGHIYMGSVGIADTLEGMNSGYVDLNWAKTHHSRWARQKQESNQVLSKEEYNSLLGANRMSVDTDTVKVK